MLEHIKIHQLNDFFLDLDKRSVKGVFFYRICGYNAEIHNFITEYYNAARMSGVIIETDGMKAVSIERINVYE